LSCRTIAHAFFTAESPLRPNAESASDADWEIASQRADALKVLLAGSSPAAVAEVAADLRLSSAMVYRLLAVYRRNPSASSLLPNRGGRTPGTRLLSSEIETVIQSSISKYYLKKERPRVADLHRQIILECRRAKLTPPSYKAVWVRVNSIDPALAVRKREGAGVARGKFASVKKGLSPKRPLELVQIDHTLADIMVVDEIERRSIGRPWLTLVIDVATRVVLGFHLSLDAPSSTSVALALSHAVLPKRIFLEEDALSGSWPTAGLPETIHLDNAKEFHSHALKRGCREHGISLTFRPPQTPHFGGHIERLIGTMMGELHLLPGTTFSSTKERGEYKSAHLASLTMRELDRWLTLQIVEVYHQRVHRAIGVPPITAWEKGLASRTVPIHHPRDAQKFYIDFLPGESRLIRRDGIQMFGIHYWDSVLSPFAGRSKDKHLIRYDPRDLSHVYMKGAPNGETLKVPYRDIGHPPITQNEHRSVVKQLRRTKRLAITEANIFAAILEQRELVRQACEDTTSARRAREKMAKGNLPHAKFRESQTISDSESRALLQRIKPYKVEVWE
jgi:putative transposase